MQKIYSLISATAATKLPIRTILTIMRLQIFLPRPNLLGISGVIKFKQSFFAQIAVSEVPRKIIAPVNHGRHVFAQRIGLRQNNGVGRVEQIGVDVIDDADALPVENFFV